MATGALLISFAPVFVRLADVAPTTAGVYRMLFGSLTLGILLALRPDFRIGLRIGWTGSLLVAAIFTADIWFWHQSIHFIGPGLATLLANFRVFILALIGIYFGFRSASVTLIPRVKPIPGISGTSR